MSNAGLGVDQATTSGLRSTATRPTTPSLLPVTALCFVPDTQILLAGTGSILNVYDYSASSVLSQCQLFQDETIHGIICRKTETGYLALCWAGSSTCTVIIDISDYGTRNVAAPDLIESLLPNASDHTVQRAGNRLIRAGLVLKCEDWILDCVFSPIHGRENPVRFVAFAVTAHNALLGFSLIDDIHSQGISKAPILKQHQLTPPTRVLLYSAHISLGANQDVFVSAGTAFGTVILWSCSGTMFHDREFSVVTHNTFQAHEDGAVFGICTFFDPRGPEIDGRKPLLATCSDDRTIKIWTTSSPTIQSGSSDLSNEIDQPDREPGPCEAGSTALVHLLAVAPPGDPKRRQGHTSRIWKICSLPSSDTAVHGALLMSLGEDATSQIWEVRQLSEESSNPGDVQLSHITTRSAHTGKNLWSSAVSAKQGASWKLATGGADGSIAVSTFTGPHSCDSYTKRAPSLASSGVPRQHIESLSISGHSSQYRSYSFITNTDLIATTSDGSVALGTVTSQSVSNEAFAAEAALLWRQIGHSDNFKGYSLTTGDTSLHLGFVGGLNGEVNGVAHGAMFPCLEANMRGKVGGLFLQKTTSSALLASCDIFLVVTQLGSREASFLLMRAETDNETGMPPWTDSSTSCLGTIPLEEGFVVTSVAHWQKSSGSDMIFLGARDGRIAWYSISSLYMEELRSERTPQALLLRTRQIHADAVTSIKLHYGRPRISATVCLLSTARDGTYACFQIGPWDCMEATGTKISQFHQLSLPFGPYIEGQYSGKDRHICLYGFHGEDFVIYDEITKQELWRVPCGGAHRIWAFCPPNDSDLATFVFTRASNIHCAMSDATGYQYATTGGHGREIKACAVSGFGSCPDSTRLIATGGEDTDIRVWSCENTLPIGKQPLLRSLYVIKKHNTGVQQLRWSSGGNYLFSCGGREEFFVWKISSLPIINIGVACVAKVPVTGSGSELRIMGFDVVRTNRGERTAKHQINMTITMALSNSSIRVYRYIDDYPQTPLTSSNRLEHMTTVTPSDHCLTALSYLSPVKYSGKSDCNETINPYAFITAGTDGAVQVWSNHSSQQPASIAPQRLSTARLHQNAVKDITTVRLLSASHQAKTYLVITVGDDNAIAFTILRFGNEGVRIESAKGTAHRDDDKDAVIIAAADVSDNNVSRAALLVPNAHAASVTAVAVISHHQSPNEDTASSESLDRLRVITTSNDQRLKVWDITIDLSKLGTSGITVKLAKNLASNVADVSSLSILPNGKKQGLEPRDEVDVLVVGVGMEIWQIGLSSQMATS